MNLPFRLLLLALVAVPGAFASEPAVRVSATRLPESPIIRETMLPGKDGISINGPSMIRVPDSVPHPLGRYYLYFAHHAGKYIRLAYADRVEGPWKLYDGGVQALADQHVIENHIASPEAVVDPVSHQIYLFYHGWIPNRKNPANWVGDGYDGQRSTVSVSDDGIHFRPLGRVVGPSYLRVFAHDGQWFALNELGVLRRAAKLGDHFDPVCQLIGDDVVDAVDPALRHEPGATPVAQRPKTGPHRYSIRHVGVDVDGDRLVVFFSCVGHRPERILCTFVDMKGPAQTWRAHGVQEVLASGTADEGANLPLAYSNGGISTTHVHELRDPAVYRQGAQTWLLYSIAGEHGIGLAKLQYGETAAASDVAVGPVAAEVARRRAAARKPNGSAPSVELLLVKNGAGRAVVVIPDEAPPSVAYAAQELVTHVAKASGATLAVVHESAPRDAVLTPIFLGDTRAARAIGIEATQLPVETFVVRTTNTALYIAGNDVVAPPHQKSAADLESDRLYNSPQHLGIGDPLNMNTSAGTLFGVYDWLEQDVGVRWLWPGEPGTYVPALPTIAARPRNQTVAPRFFQRAIRPGVTFPVEHPALGFTAKAAEAYANDVMIYLRRHRMGRGTPITYHHAFVDWWDKYGKDHPAWFQLNPDGTRGPEKPGGRFSMSVSNPGLAEQVVALWQADPNHPKYINAVENDIPGLCSCADCRAWDGPPPPDYQAFTPKTSKVYGKPFVTDRYVKFWLRVQQLAAQTDPDVNVVGYAYFNYFEPPTSGVKLNPHIVIGYCPSSYWYPRSPDEHAWFKRQWTGWAKTGARVFSRTNYFLDGYCMPYIFAHQFADDFEHEAGEGMAGTDFDSLTGAWATQGPNLYLLMRLHTEPAANPDQLLAEYYAAFGPAMAAVKAYFDYWEKYLAEHRDRLGAPFEKLGGSRWRTFAKASHAVFPPECFGPAEAILGRAASAAAADADAAKRVQFLRDGLTHAMLCARVSALLSSGDPTATPERGAPALAELLAFRRAHEREWIANFNHTAWQEDVGWKLGAETKQAPELYP